jgi:putative transposase
MRPARKRQIVDEVRTVWQVSIRRACQALPVDRSTYHYRSKRPGQAILTKRIKEIAETRVRYGYRRIHVLLRREGWLVNAKRICRLYREMGLQLRSKSPKRRVKAQLREDRSPATAANQVWAMDFVHDQLFDGRKIRVLTVVDTFTRLSPAIEVRAHFRGADVVETLERVSEDDPARQRAGIHQQGARFVGLHARCHIGFQPAWQADRQRLHRKPKRQVPGRVPECQLVPQPRRSPPEMRGLA